ncbi:MAG: GNAT family N-acetyltransferase [Pseudonocardiaceae bacterium]
MTTNASLRAWPRGPSFRCPERLVVTASARSPVTFGQWLHFEVTELTAGGAQLAAATDDVGPGAELAFTVVLPFTGTHEVRGVVLRVTRDAVDVGWRQPQPAFLGGVAEYLMLAGGRVSPATLRAAGFPVRAVDRAVTFGEGTPSDLGEILDLRVRAYRHEGLRRDVTAADLASPFDAFSRHLVCRYGGRIVGYARVIVVGGDPARSQYVSWGGHEVPPWLWEAGFVEGGAGAVDPEFQGVGLFLLLVQHVVGVATRSGYRYVLGACDDGLVDMYASMGFEPLETRYVEPRPGWRFRSHLIVLDLDGLLADRLSGRNVAAMRSAALFGRDAGPGSLGEGQHLGDVAAQRPGTATRAGGQPQDE